MLGHWWGIYKKQIELIYKISARIDYLLFTVKDDQDSIKISSTILHDVATWDITKTSSTCARCKKTWFRDEYKEYN